MNCERVMGRLPDYAAQALPERARAEIEQHLRDCDRCRRELQALDRAVELFEMHAVVEPPPGLWIGVHQRLTEGASLPELRPAWWSALFHGSWRRPGSSLAFGAALAVVAFVVLIPTPGVQRLPLEFSHHSRPGSGAPQRQHALSAAEGPFGDRAAWELTATPAESAGTRP